MSTVEIICLANSRKLSGRCVAGLRTDGGGWIRPVTGGTGELGLQQVLLDDRSMVQVLDIVQMNLGNHVPKPYQPEDWELGTTPWTIVERPASGSPIALIRGAVQTETTIFGTSGDRMSAGIVAGSPPPSSLTLVRPENARFMWTVGQYKRKSRVTFELGEEHYDLAVTDPAWEERIADLEEGPHDLTGLGLSAGDDIVLTVSLGEPFGGYHYKLVAAIVQLPARSLPTSGVPEIHLHTDDLERLASLQGPFGFSCNDRREVWPSVVHGLTPSSLRVPLHGQDPVLDQIVAAVTRVRPGGGRFYLADDGVRLSRSHELLVLFRFK